MPKKLIKKLMPDSETIRKHKSLQFLGERLHEPNLWHLNRRSVALAFAVGLLIAWVPTPGQMAIAAIIAFYVRANLPISVALVWITNPLTMAPMFYFAYRVGLGILQRPLPGADFKFSMDSVMNGLGDIWQPFLLGCLVLGIVSAVIGYFGISWFWRYHVSKRWGARPHR
ncbi:MAG: DUF2062 domain-containing protein [Gammaproteobacteria bacterium HGW-Gammaproteobacteria-3]|nr:MAG: DUF2062 domain-containing protein [Gammaproteobacteria bacterium HGW-Gammaproteobacteria-3]